MNRPSSLASTAAERILAFEANREISMAGNRSGIASRVHDTLERRLSLVIGDAGLKALFARTLKLATPKLEILANVEGSADSAMAHLCSSLKAQSLLQNLDVLQTLLSTFIGVLSTFIGEGLTWRLLRSAWPDALPIEPARRDDNP